MTFYTPQVFRDNNARPILVFRKGRKLYHAVVADTTIKLDTLETLRGLLPLDLKGEPYPPKRVASFWLNHDHREITPRAKLVLRELVARKPRTTKSCAEQQQNLAAAVLTPEMQERIISSVQAMNEGARAAMLAGHFHHYSKGKA